MGYDMSKTWKEDYMDMFVNSKTDPKEREFFRKSIEEEEEIYKILDQYDEERRKREERFTNPDGTVNYKEMMYEELLENTRESKIRFYTRAIKQAESVHMEEGNHEALEKMRAKYRGGTLEKEAEAIAQDDIEGKMDYINLYTEKGEKIPNRPCREIFEEAYAAGEYDGYYQ